MSGLVLLTGATGFVGRQVLRALGERGVLVRAVVRDGAHNRLETSAPLERRVTTADLFAEDSAWWADACQGVDTVIHVAWYAEPGHYLQSSKNGECLAGTLRLADAACRVGVRRFVGIGTCFEYDLDAGSLTVETSLKPTTPYAEAKAAAYEALSQRLPAKGVEFALVPAVLFVRRRRR